MRAAIPMCYISLLHHKEIRFPLGFRRQWPVTVALIALLSLSSREEVGEAIGAGPIGWPSKKVTVSGTVLARASIRFIDPVPELVITQADLSKGVIDSLESFRIEIKNNSSKGYLLVFDRMKGSLDLFSEVWMGGFGREIRIERGRSEIAMPSEGPKSVVKEIRYRFILSNDAQPGTYRWPILLSVKPVE